MRKITKSKVLEIFQVNIRNSLTEYLDETRVINDGLIRVINWVINYAIQFLYNTGTEFYCLDSNEFKVYVRIKLASNANVHGVVFKYKILSTDGAPNCKSAHERTETFIST